jgi:hypothetical protein
MTEHVVSGFAKHELRSEYAKFRTFTACAFAGSDLLWNLGKIAWRAFYQEEDSARLVALTLALTFCDVASRFESDTITADMGEHFFTIIDQAIMQCLDSLFDRSGETTQRALIALSTSYANLLAARKKYSERA